MLTGAPQTGATEASGSPAPLGAPPSGQGPGFGFMLPVILVMVFFVGMSVMASRRDKKRQQTLMDSLKRNDQVLTIGGIIGTVAEVRDDHILLRLDENTKVKVVRTAIQRNLSEAPAASARQPQVEVKSKSDSGKEKLVV